MLHTNNAFCNLIKYKPLTTHTIAGQLTREEEGQNYCHALLLAILKSEVKSSFSVMEYPTHKKN